MAMRTHNIDRHKRNKDWQRTLHRIQPYRTARALWLTLASSLLLTCVMFLGAIDPHSHSLDSTFHPTYALITTSIAFLLYYTFNFWIIRIGLDTYRSRFFAAIGSLSIAAVYALIVFALERQIYSGLTSYNLYITLVFYLISVLLASVTKYQQTIVENEHLQAENMLIRYETLEHQVGPHFLFNSLNTLDGLIGTNDATAHTYLHHLASIFRYTIQQQKEVTLEEELNFTHAYIYLMQLRHGNNLVVHENIAPSALPLRMPPISLQLLIENAIKHNIISTRHPLTISIQSTDDSHALRVINPLQPKTDIEPSTGIGLVNLAQRYELQYHQAIRIQQDQSTFTVELPLIAN